MSEPLDLDTARVPDAVPATAPAAARTPEQLRQLAEQFESVLMGQMLREMRASMFDDDKDTGFSNGPLSDTLFGELSLALSRAGGLGLGQALAAPLARQAQVGGSAAPILGSSFINASGAPLAGAALSRGEDSESSSAGAAASGGGAPLALIKDDIAAAMKLARPDGPVSSAFGWRRDPLDGAMKFHKGIDVAVPVGTDVTSPRDGAVTFAGQMSGYGLTVVVDHGDGLATRYAHLSEISVNVGDVVREGQLLARSGATGRVTGPHLHFEVLSDGRPIDPQ